MGFAASAHPRSGFVLLKTAFLLSELKFRPETGWRTNSHGAIDDCCRETNFASPGGVLSVRTTVFPIFFRPFL